MLKPGKTFLIALIAFSFGVAVGVFGRRLLVAIFGKDGGSEFMRATSPDGKLDAVLVEDASGGALDGVFWCVYVVPRGQAVPKDMAKRVFFADEMTKGTVVWNKPHLIEIHYDEASIMHFRNISTETENGAEYVELQLAPSSEYSLITPEGSWRPDN